MPLFFHVVGKRRRATPFLMGWLFVAFCLCLLLVPGIPIAHVHVGFDRDKQVDDPDHQGSQKRSKNRYAEARDDELSEINHDGTDQEADNTTIVRRNSISENGFYGPANQSDDNGRQQSCPKTANRKAGDQKADKHQDYGSDDKADDMAHDRQVYSSFRVVSPYILSRKE